MDKLSEGDTLSVGKMFNSMTTLKLIIITISYWCLSMLKQRIDKQHLHVIIKETLPPHLGINVSKWESSKGENFCKIGISKAKKKLYEKTYAYEVTYSGSTCILSAWNLMGIRCIHEWQCNHQIHNLPFSESFFFPKLRIWHL